LFGACDRVSHLVTKHGVDLDAGRVATGLFGGGADLGDEGAQLVDVAFTREIAQRVRLERLCRYITRPALCLDRLSANSTGQIVYQLKNPFRDGTTHVVFNPADFIARLAALVPRPRANLSRYHGVFAPSSPFRPHIVPAADKPHRPKSKTDNTTLDHPPTDQSAQIHHTTAITESPTDPLSWAQRLKRVFNIDITLCPRCGGQLRVIGDITDPDLIRKILDHVNSRAPPRLPPRRAEPHQKLPDRFAER
jgi:hypothetical protein